MPKTTKPLHTYDQHRSKSSGANPSWYAHPHMLASAEYLRTRPALAVTMFRKM